jgi:hypothetical protein
VQRVTKNSNLAEIMVGYATAGGKIIQVPLQSLVPTRVRLPFFIIPIRILGDKFQENSDLLLADAYHCLISVSPFYLTSANEVNKVKERLYLNRHGQALGTTGGRGSQNL